MAGRGLLDRVDGQVAVGRYLVALRTKSRPRLRCRERRPHPKNSLGWFWLGVSRRPGLLVLGAQGQALNPRRPRANREGRWRLSDRSGVRCAPARSSEAVCDEASAACREGRIDVSTMEELLGNMLAKQLAGFYTAAGGKLPSGVELSAL
jgi:hypothetical protein